MSSFWSHCLAHFERELSAQQFTTWLRPLSAIENESQVIVLAPNSFVGKWVRDRFLTGIEAQAASFFDKPVSVEVRVDSAMSNTSSSPPMASNGSDAIAAARVSPALMVPVHHAREPRGFNVVAERAGIYHPAPTSLATIQPELGSSYANALNSSLASSDSIQKESALNTSFTFDSFVTGKANQLARAAAQKVASDPGDAYNPLFIYGGVGLGKTHLLQAIGNELLQHHPRARVRYIHAERYVSDVVKAYQHKAWDAFKASYNSLDLLLIDDIQFFNNKGSTQEQFFYLFNTLIEAKKQVIITCDTYPKEIEGIEDRLKSRFSWGLTVQVEPPETEMRVAILLAKAKQTGAALDENTAFFIAKHIRSNVRELEGGLKRVIAYAGFHNVEINPQIAKEALRDLLAVQSRQISVENIQKVVADYYKVKVSDMHSKNRSRIVARPRQMAMALAKELTSLSLPEIGQNFGGRDHTTVLHACRQIASLRESAPQIQHDYSFLLQLLRS
ncbi:MAG: chromosomal replication initiator protein DnaA [Casimicrobium sp.]